MSVCCVLDGAHMHSLNPYKHVRQGQLFPIHRRGNWAGKMAQSVKMLANPGDLSSNPRTQRGMMPASSSYFYTHALTERERERHTDTDTQIYTQTHTQT